MRGVSIQGKGKFPEKRPTDCMHSFALLHKIQFLREIYKNQDGKIGELHN